MYTYNLTVSPLSDLGTYRSDRRYALFSSHINPSSEWSPIMILPNVSVQAEDVQRAVAPRAVNQRSSSDITVMERMEKMERTEKMGRMGKVLVGAVAVVEVAEVKAGVAEEVEGMAAGAAGAEWAAEEVGR